MNSLVTALFIIIPMVVMFLLDVIPGLSDWLDKEASWLIVASIITACDISVVIGAVRIFEALIG